MSTATRDPAPLSATSTSPLPVTATPTGCVKRAPAVPSPSLLKEVPLPAMVVTTPAGVTRRMQKFPVSATTSPPCGSTARPEGKRNSALVPRLLANPGRLPVPPPPTSTDVASVPRSTTRTRWALYSRIKSCGGAAAPPPPPPPPRSSARATGVVRSAAVPMPSASPAATPLGPPPTKEVREAFPAHRALTLLLLRSAMSRAPAASSYARPRGVKRVVAPPATAPSRAPCDPLPATVLTPPAVPTRRIL